MKWILAGLVLIAVGVVALMYRGIPYKTEDRVLDLGPIHATAEQEKTLAIPPWVSAGIVATGAALLVVGGRSGRMRR